MGLRLHERHLHQAPRPTPREASDVTTRRQQPPRPSGSQDPGGLSHFPPSAISSENRNTDMYATNILEPTFPDQTRSPRSTRSSRSSSTRSSPRSPSGGRRPAAPTDTARSPTCSSRTSRSTSLGPRRSAASAGCATSCLEGALDRVEPWGVWGGELIENGRIVVNKRPRGRPPKHPRPGRRGRRGTDPTAPRRLADRPGPCTRAIGTVPVLGDASTTPGLNGPAPCHRTSPPPTR